MTTTTQAMPRATWSPPRLLTFLEEYVLTHGPAIPLADPRDDQRTYSLLELSDDLEIWAIHWPPDQGLQLHDHGGSAGALWVVAGGLDEVAVDPSGQRSERYIRAGRGVAFGPAHIHDVVNRQHAATTS